MRHILLFGCLIYLSSCGNARQENNKLSNYTNRKNSMASLREEIDYLIVGRFCSECGGECGGECATMYKLDKTKDIYYVDHTDSYWNSRYGKKIVFKNIIGNKDKKLLLEHIFESIPTHFLTTKKISEQFGCPDCSDGCGIYLELKIDTVIKQFYIDYQTKELKRDIKPFAELLRRNIEQLENMTDNTPNR